MSLAFRNQTYTKQQVYSTQSNLTNNERFYKQKSDDAGRSKPDDQVKFSTDEGIE